MKSQRSSHTHLQAASSQRTYQCLQKSVSAPTRKEFQNFSPTLKRKKLKHANTQATQTEARMERMTILI
jgi:hypothetical protein